MVNRNFKIRIIRWDFRTKTGYRLIKIVMDHKANKKVGYFCNFSWKIPQFKKKLNKNLNMYLTGPPPSTFLCRFQGVLFYSAFAADSHPVERKK